MPPLLAGDAVGTYPIQECLGIDALDVVLGESGEIEDAYALMHGGHFIAYHLEHVRAGIAGLFGAPVEREPLRPLPAERLGVHASFCFQPSVQRARLARATGRLLLPGQARGEREPVILEGLVVHVGPVRELAVAPRIEFRHVDLGIAMEHPLREILAASAALSDAERASAAHPVVLEPRCGAEERRAIRRVGDGAVDHAANAHLAEYRHALDGALEPRGDAVQIVREQLVAGVPLRVALRGPRLGKPRVFVNSHEARFLLLPQVSRGTRVADHRNLLAPLLERRNGVGDHVMMLHVGDGGIRAHHGRDLACVAARRVHHHFRDDGSLLRNHFPFAAHAPAHVGHAVVPHDARTQIAGGLGERVADPGRVAMTIVPSPGGGEHALRVEKRIQAPDLVQADDVHAKADAPRVAQHVFEPVELLGVVGEAQPAARMPARVLTGERLEPWVELVAVGVNLGEVVAAGDARALTGSVPG